jgi:metal-sulfur cluster biosynthetic enzyme
MTTIHDLAIRITKIPHPFINYSLTELGIITDIDLEEDRVSLEFVWPFPNIPIKSLLIDSVANLIDELGLQWKYTERIMDAEEKKYFLALEKEGWKK